MLADKFCVLFFRVTLVIRVKLYILLKTDFPLGDAICVTLTGHSCL